jgi:hypothetical protein
VFFMGLFLGLILGGILLLSRKVQAQINLHRANKENIRLREQLKELEQDFDKKTDAHRATVGVIDSHPSERALAKNIG